MTTLRSADRLPMLSTGRRAGRLPRLLGLLMLVLLGHAWLASRLVHTGPAAPPTGAAPLRQPAVSVRQLPRQSAPPVAAPVANRPVAPAPAEAQQRRAAEVSIDRPQDTAAGLMPGEGALAPGPPAQGAAPVAALAAALAEDESGLPPPLYPVRLPDPVQLRYALSINGQSGEAVLIWRHDGQRYSLQLDGLPATPGRPLLAQASQGAVAAEGLAPERFVDRRRGGRQQAANFQHDTGHIVFSGPAVRYPAWPGAQDRLSWLAQLAAILAAGHAQPEVQLFVVDARGLGGLWRLQRLDDQWLPTPGGEAWLQQWQREPPRPEGLRVQAWLDPARGHWPVQLRFSVPRSGHVLELRLLAEPTSPP